jgi:hypothetical protein
MIGLFLTIAFAMLALTVLYLLIVVSAHDRQIGETHALLVTWAESWGDPPDAVKMKLHAIVRSFRTNDRRKQRR